MKWISLLLLASLFRCGSFTKAHLIMDGYQYQIIVQTQPGIDLSLQDNAFSGAGEQVQKLNKALSEYQFQLSPIESKVTKVADYQQFRLLTNDDPDEIVKRLLSFSSLIDGAYRKDFAEDAKGDQDN